MRYAVRQKICVFYASLLIAACQSSNGDWTYREKSEVGPSSERNLSVSATPVSVGLEPGLNCFELSIANHTDQNPGESERVAYEILWDKTLYMRRDQTEGGFYFVSDWTGAPVLQLENPHWQGLTNPAPKPPDVVLPGQSFTKIICPATLARYGYETYWRRVLMLADLEWWAKEGLQPWKSWEEMTVGKTWYPSKMGYDRHGVFLTMVCQDCGDPPVHFVVSYRIGTASVGERGSEPITDADVEERCAGRESWILVENQTDQRVEVSYVGSLCTRRTETVLEPYSRSRLGGRGDEELQLSVSFNTLDRVDRTFKDGEAIAVRWIGGVLVPESTGDRPRSSESSKGHPGALDGGLALLRPAQID